MHNLSDLQLASGIRRGIERECLRVSTNGEIAQTPHNKALGSALTHPYITTDYSEALLEFVTPIFQDPKELLSFLKDLHLFTLKHIGDELFWSNSMPCLLKGNHQIPIAYYGESNIGKMKTIYRKGLLHRYGSAMQVISGVHFNFSLTDECLEKLRQRDCFQGELQDYKSQKYMATIRNLHKHSWVIPYLLGSSPTLCQSFLNQSSHDYGLVHFDKQGTLSYPGATSLRLSRIGYTNMRQSQVNISYNSLGDYIKGLRKAIVTHDKNWKKIGIKKNGKYQQLNNNVLQLENEYYSGARPKCVANSGESPTNAFLRGGVEYIELRSLDVNSFSSIGIDLDQVLFLDVFLLYCLLTKDERPNPQTTKEYRKNQEIIAHHGRKDKAIIFRAGTHISLFDWAQELFDGLLEIAESLDGAYPYSKVIKSFQASLTQQYRLYSARLENEMREKDKSFFDHTLKNSMAIKNHLLSKSLHPDQEKYLTRVGRQSLEDQKSIEELDTLSFEHFLEQYFRQNTQLN